MKVKPNINQDVEENHFWASLSDMMLGMLIVFIILFVSTLSGLSKKKMENIKVQTKVVGEIIKELKGTDLNIDINQLNGDIKISDLELFKVGEDKLSIKGKQLLNKLIPVYFNTLLGDEKIKGKLKQIIIEGHADSQSFTGLSKDANYLKNLSLSTRRAIAVTNYIVSLDYPEKNMYKGDILKLIATTGRSFSEPILINGKEDYTKSRRVELKFKLKDFEVLDVILKHYSKDAGESAVVNLQNIDIDKRLLPEVQKNILDEKTNTLQENK